jgi:GT2 family glycosyltransferase
VRHPERDRPARARLVAEVCGPVDGASAERLTALIRSLAGAGPRTRGILEEAGYGSVGVPDTPAGELAPGCSVLVCTRNRPALLERFLDSLALQSPTADALIIVDASADAASRIVLERHPRRDALARRIRYLRVDGSLAGVTRQRNLGLGLVATELVAVLDDDIVLLPGCLAALATVHRKDPQLAGVGAYIENEQDPPSLMWWLRRALGIVPTLAPGRYFGSGISTPWRFAAPPNEPVEGDWLPGGAVMWRTGLARASGFADELDGYGVGNDLEFSLRIGRRGRQVVTGEARLLHLQQPGGRPDPERLGYESLRNWWYIHAVGGGDRLGSRLWFGYAVVMETALQSLNLLRPAHARDTWRYLRGASRFLRERAAAAGPA